MTLHTSTRRTAPVAVGLALVAGLAGCSAHGDTHPSPSSSPSTSVTTAAAVTCPDGKAVVTEDDAVVRLDGSCSSLEIRASKTQVTAGRDLDTMTVSGKLNYVRVEAVGAVSFDEDSEGNRIVTPSQPQVDDQGRSNVVAPAPEGY
ncbi:hypothetical protein M3666_00310 [Curtobacterium sp. ODYSSEY 48 V2]|uniref:hypothetical protein n=1 Tax=unclassified Curtobacterium TaxID=257496 RepID=UPI001AE65A96|nr:MULTISPECIES: hypothetical protein [unclassified Curtobacterium]MBP1301388.1 hypothetical protein [Curtobacterium sp. 1310]MCM3503559.1 hypothetical protein [Curtobacterium sp. ODYSSEY 48 V2]MDB6428331.1 hypothetical protein [Curtobacterium sp. 20TX0008]